MVKKVTRMLIKVDLHCCRCYKKIKKILCEFPQIRDQTYDEKKNEVLITVVCCSPEKIRQNIICKGGKTVQSVEILPEKPVTPEPQPPPPPPVPAFLMVPVYPMVPVCCCPPFYGRYGGGPCYCGNRGYYVCRCDYFSEENANACTVM